MCGICGVMFKDPGRPVEEAWLKCMCDTLIHRGPDDQGWVLQGPCGLGMRRLSIIDLVTGHQPLSNEDGSVTIVFNGEIYNFQSLRRELETLGHHFVTRSDTEVIVHGYEAWGEEVGQHLNGMFAFAIWDSRRNRLLLCRDRLGIKPLYYYEDSEKIVFGSELKAILRMPHVQRNLDLTALAHFLTFEYVPSPYSIFKEIHKLPQGHYLLFESGRVQVRPFWRLTPHVEPISEKEACARLRDLISDSVRLRLVSDVPLGAFLSGGIDSTIVVTQMAAHMDRPVKTFSIGFTDASYNELHYARAVARDYGTEHHEFVITPDALDLTEKLIGHLDEPFGDFSIFPTYLVSQMARRYVTVCLSGDGGDELFAGYDTYRAHRFDRWFYRWIPPVVKKSCIRPLARMLPPTPQKKGWINSFKRFVTAADLPDSLLHARWMVFLMPEDRARLLTEEVLGAIRGADPFGFILDLASATRGLDDVTRTGYIDVMTYLADDILVKVDRMSMAVSLEARVPYLDYRIVEFAFSLPPDLKMKGFDTKVLLKKAFWKDLPHEIRHRDKQGFSIPIKQWIRGPLRPMMEDLLAPTRLRNQGLFCPEYVTQLMEAHIQGRENHSHLLWALMVFQKWDEIYGKSVSGK